MSTIRGACIAMRSLALLCTCILIGASSPSSASALPAVHPVELSKYAEEHPTLTFPVVVTATGQLTAISAQVLESILSRGTDQQYSFRLPIINSVSVSLRGTDLVSLLGNSQLRQIWYYTDTAHFLFCVRVIRAIAYSVSNHIPLMNISSQSPERLFDPGEPVNLAMHAAFDAGALAIVAAGNNGPTPGSLSAWCSPWVICVGATTQDGRQLANFSARAETNETVSLPTVVAPGVDVLTAHPSYIKKSNEMIAAEKRVHFDALVPPEKRDSYTVVSGTSFSAPHVTRIETLLIRYVQAASKEVRARGRNTFDVTYKLPLNRKPDARTTSKRLVGTLRWNGSQRVITYPAKLSPALLQQITMDLAVGVNHYDSTSIGAGFIDWNGAVQVFGRYGVPPPELVDLKVE